MSAKTIAAALLAMLVLGAAIFIFSTQQKETETQLTISGAPQTARIGQTIKINANATGQQQILKIISINSQDQKEIACTQNNCSAKFEYKFLQQGAHQIEFVAQNSLGKTVSKKIIIKVIENKKTCIDSTQLNECSTKKPLYCENGELAEKCDQCGCPNATECTQNSCKPISKRLQIISAQPLPAKIVKENLQFGAKIRIKNEENDIVAKGAKYTIIATLINEGPTAMQNQTETTEIYLANELAQNESFETEIRLNGVLAGTYSLQAELAANQTTQSTFLQQQFVESSNEKTPPAAPTGFNAVLNGKKATLSWNQNTENDIAGYKIYKSTSVDPTHIKYSLYQTVQSQTTSLAIDEITEGKHYFVMKAFDFLENESQYSQTAKIEKS